MIIELECTYCGHIWQKQVYNTSGSEAMRCINGNCNDYRLKVKDVNKSKVDYYKGSPPFPPKKDWEGGYF